MEPKQDAPGLVAKAIKYRGLARYVTDRETSRRILDLVEELKEQARDMAKPDEQSIRKRARLIWEQHGRPVGRDVEFWLRAEKELQDAAIQKEVPEDI
jgi:Protein of unknown function (DUF2934)